MAFTTQQIQSNITIPFRRRFVGYTNILLFYEKPKATPFQKLKALSLAFNQNLKNPGNPVSIIYIHSIFPPKMFQAMKVICKTFIIPDSTLNNDNICLETTRKSAEHADSSLACHPKNTHQNKSTLNSTKSILSIFCFLFHHFTTSQTRGQKVFACQCTTV